MRIHNWSSKERGVGNICSTLSSREYTHRESPIELIQYKICSHQLVKLPLFVHSTQNNRKHQ